MAYDPEQFLKGVKAPFSRQNNFLDAGQYLSAGNTFTTSDGKTFSDGTAARQHQQTLDSASGQSAVNKVEGSVSNLVDDLAAGTVELESFVPTNTFDTPKERDGDFVEGTLGKNNLPTFSNIRTAIDAVGVGQPINLGRRQDTRRYNVAAIDKEGYGAPPAEESFEPDPGKYLSLKDRRDGGGPGYAGDVYGIGGGRRADLDLDGYITFAENEKNPLDQNFLTGMSNAAYKLGQSVGSATSNLFGRSFDEDDYQGPAAPINDQVEIGGVRYNTKSDDSAYSAPADPKGNDGGFISFMDRFDGGGPGESRAEEIERGGGDGGFSRVICTELYKQGKLDMDLYRMDIVYTAKRLSPITVRGYHHWAVPMVVRMRSSTSLSNLFEYLTVARAKEIARIVKPESHKRTLSGFLIKNIGEAICFSIGLFVGQKDWSVLYNGEANNG